MRTIRLMVVAALAASLLPAFASAQVESTPIPAPAKPNFSPLAYMIGKWTCKTKSSRRPTAYTTVSTYSYDPTGYWINEVSYTPKTSWVPTGLRTWDKITDDMLTHRWVDVFYGDGGSYGLSFSRGPQKGQWIWRDVSFMPNADIGSQSDLTLTKVSDTRVMGTSWFTEAKSGRRVTVTMVCTKG